MSTLASLFARLAATMFPDSSGFANINQRPAVGDVSSRVADTTFANSLSANGQCRLIVGSPTTAFLKPSDGNILRINGAVQHVPSAGVSLSTTGLTANQLYYVYAAMSGTTMIMEASATGHVTSAADGTEVKSGDASRALVGMMVPNSSLQLISNNNNLALLSYFSRKEVCLQPQIQNAQLATSSPTELNTNLRVTYLCWADDGNDISAEAWVSNTVAQAACVFGIGMDSNSVYSGLAAQLNVPFANAAGFFAAHNVPTLSEGQHYATCVGATSVGTASYNGIIKVKVRG